MSTDYFNYVTGKDMVLRKEREATTGEPDFFSISYDTAMSRMTMAYICGDVPKSVADHFKFILSEIKQEVNMDDNMSVQDMLNAHYAELLKVNYETYSEMSEIKGKCFRTASHAAISDMARELTVDGEDGRKYALVELCGVDVISEKYDKYMEASKKAKDVIEFDADVIPYLFKVDCVDSEVAINAESELADSED